MSRFYYPNTLANRFSVVVDAHLLSKKENGEGLTREDIILLQNKFYLFSEWLNEPRREAMIANAQEEINKRLCK